MKTSINGLTLIRDSEGLVLHEYEDNGKMAIGYGHDLLPGESYPNGITESEAGVINLKDVAEIEPRVSSLVPPGCTQNQFDACIDFAYNLGVGKLRTMLSHGWNDVPNQILRWNHEDGVVSPGLTRRRQRELELFLTP